MIHPKAIELIKLYEGFDSHPYKCPADVWTYGYGATRNIEGERVTSSTEPISKLEAEELLIKMVGRFASRGQRLPGLVSRRRSEAMMWLS